MLFCEVCQRMTGLKGPRLDDLVQALHNTRGTHFYEKSHLEVGGWLKERDTRGFDCDANSLSMFSGETTCKSTLKSPPMGKRLQVPPGNVCFPCFLLKLLGQNLALRNEVTV